MAGPIGFRWTRHRGLAAAALAVVVALIFIARSVFTRWSGRSGGIVQSPAIEVLSRITIAPRNHVLLVRLGGRILLAGTDIGTAEGAALRRERRNSARLEPPAIDTPGPCGPGSGAVAQAPCNSGGRRRLNSPMFQGPVT